jgi:hypothetical protein
MTRKDADELRALAQTLTDGMASPGYAIEQLEDDARRLAEAVLAKVRRA